MANGIQGDFRRVVQVELGHQVGSMHSCCLLANVKQLGDLCNRITFGYQLEDLPFTSGQSTQAARFEPFLSLADVLRDDLFRYAWT